jgi:DNA (cytosine-5)-methyltransferase 1
MRHLDLFSGIGGFALAASWAGFRTVEFVEKDKFCKKVLEKHWPWVPIHDDIKTFNFTDKVDLLTAGFPCQPFSVAGKKKGIKDDRYLWPEVIRIIKQSRPTWFIGENVPGIIPMLDPILEDLEKEGYIWRAYLISANAVNAPHKRERLWIVANSNGKRCDNGTDNREERYIQDNLNRNIEAVHTEWSKLQPESWKTMQAEDYFALNSHASRIDDGLPNRLDRIKSLGNAIVPQVVYSLMRSIYLIEKELRYDSLQF